MKTLVNWSRLVSRGDVKAVGVPWNDEEIKARYKLKIPAEHVRNGILTLEQYKATQLEHQTSVEELYKKAKEVGSTATEAAPREILEKEIQQLSKKKSTIEQLREDYTKKTGKKLSFRYMNDEEWLREKVNNAA